MNLVERCAFFISCLSHLGPNKVITRSVLKMVHFRTVLPKARLHTHLYSLIISFQSLSQICSCQSSDEIEPPDYSFRVFSLSSWRSTSNFLKLQPTKNSGFQCPPRGPKKINVPLLHGDALGIQGESLGNLMCRIRGVVLHNNGTGTFSHPCRAKLLNLRNLLAAEDATQHVWEKTQEYAMIA